MRSRERQVYTTVVFVLSMLANVTLLLVLLSTRTSYVGSYRYLLAAFACMDVMISLAHLACIPVSIFI